mmetsp:Transcript_37345/g.111882  ORF Transcript_37345/g.111882 Transcript_37345/m.111882 type:complete len:82 (+) Transcript_37345:4038-4283(+)
MLDEFNGDIIYYHGSLMVTVTRPPPRKMRRPLLSGYQNEGGRERCVGGEIPGSIEHPNKEGKLDETTKGNGMRPPHSRWST